MNKKTLLILLVLLSACQPLTGNYNYSFDNLDWEGCTVNCYELYDVMNCTGHFYVWEQFNNTGNCTCRVSGCYNNYSYQVMPLD